MNNRTRKSLLQSYYRQRKIGAEQSSQYKLNPYELNDFAIKNGLINISELSIYDIYIIFFKHPQLIDYFKDRLGELNSEYISNILSKHPQLIDYFKDRLGEISSYRIMLILKKQPQLIRFFKEYIPEFIKDEITMVTNTPNTYIVPNGHIISEYVEKNNGYVVQYFETKKYGILDKNFKLITNNYYDIIGYGFDNTKLSFGRNIGDDVKFFNIDGKFFDVDKNNLGDIISNFDIYSKEQR